MVGRWVLGACTHSISWAYLYKNNWCPNSRIWLQVWISRCSVAVLLWGGRLLASCNLRGSVLYLPLLLIWFYWGLFFQSVTDYYSPICDTYPTICWDVLFIDENYGVCPFHSAWNSLCQLSYLVSIWCPPYFSRYLGLFMRCRISISSPVS